MEPHLTIKYDGSDEDVAELCFEVSDGASQFVNSAYVGLDWLRDQAAGLATFSRQVHGGIYNLGAGDRGPEYARGAFEARFHYYKPTELYISTYQQAEYFDFKKTQVASEATLYLRTEPGLLDEFGKSLKALERNAGSSAILKCISLHGA
jgi:hypothetical protein